MLKSADLYSKSMVYSKCNAAKKSKKSSGGFLGGVVGAVTNFFSGKASETKPSDMAPQQRNRAVIAKDESIMRAEKALKVPSAMSSSIQSFVPPPALIPQSSPLKRCEMQQK